MFFKKRKWSNPVGRAADDQREIAALCDQLYETTPHVPKHVKPDLDSIGEGLAWAAGFEGTKWAFEYFEDYPDSIHRLSSPDDLYDIGPWRLEQRADPFHPQNFADGPVIAVSFNLFYNSLDVGKVVLQPRNRAFVKRPDTSLGVFLDVQIQCAPLIPAHHIRGILGATSEALSFDEDGHCDPRQRVSILEAMCSAQWEASRTNSKFTELHFAHSGHVLVQAKL